MKISVVILMLLSAVGFCLPSAAAEEFKPVLVYQGEIDKNSFSISIHEGVERFKKKTGDDCTEVVVGTNFQEYLDEITKYAEQGRSPIFLIYGNHFPDLVDFVHSYPAIRFILLDTFLDEPNVYSFVLADHEGSFLAGALAAMASQSGKIGFVSVVDIPYQRRFLCGYTQGAKYIRPDIEVFKAFTGKYEGAWFDGNATAALADKMMDEGADVIFQAAGGAGPAVLEACAKRGKLGIGVDINQNDLYPGSVLTSMVKHTDKAVYAALMLAKRGIWRDNYKRLGLEQEAVGIVFDRHNDDLVSPEMRSRIEKIRKKIVLGEIIVHEYTENPICPDHAK